MVITERTHQQQLLQIALGQGTSDQSLRRKEQAIYDLAQVYIQQGQHHKIVEFVNNHRNELECYSKPKTAKILRLLIEKLQQVNGSQSLQIQMCQGLIKWCQQQKRNYLKHRIILKLSNLQLKINKPIVALQLIQPVVIEVRKADDKHLLVQINLLDSRINFALQKYAKAKASLTSARANANLVYCSPSLMAQIDLHSGILYAQDKDYKTSYSFFYESFQGFNSISDRRALSSLKYMLLCKIMCNLQEDINQILSSKNSLKYAGPHITAMQQLSKANNKKSVVEFKKVLDTHRKYIIQDFVLNMHIEGLYDQLVEQNLFLIIQPYHRVQLSFVAKKIVLQQSFVQAKLSQMILDKKIEGTLDQNNSCLIRYEQHKPDQLYANGIKQIEVMNQVIDKITASVKMQRANKQ